MAEVSNRYCDSSRRISSMINVLSDLMIAAALVLGALSVSDGYLPVAKDGDGVSCARWPPEADAGDRLHYCYADGKNLFWAPILAVSFATVGNLGCAATRYFQLSESNDQSDDQRLLFYVYLLYFVPLIVAFCVLLVPGPWVMGDAELDQINNRQKISGVIVLVVTSLHFFFGLASLRGSKKTSPRRVTDGYLLVEFN